MPKTATPFPATVARTAALLLAAAAAACGGTVAPATEARLPSGECSAPAVNADGLAGAGYVHWVVQSDRNDRYELDQWCRGVGAPVVAGNEASEVVRVDSVAVVTWNTHLGEARLDAFVDGLRSGAVTGVPTPHFVLLIQEARRADATVPALLDGDARGTRRQGRRDAGADVDIVVTARRLGLRLFYVPSMRNGRHTDAEDRGNAILSSLPLAELTAIELPLLAQRRVAVAATIPLLDAAGGQRSLRVSSVHLDYGASRTRPLAPFGAGRALQAGALAGALRGGGTTVVGGDFNTWTLDRMERGLTLMQERFPDFPPGASAPTFHTAGIWPRTLDHLFLRAGDAAGSAPVRIDDRWGSDHFPVMAWIRFPPANGQ